MSRKIRSIYLGLLLLVGLCIPTQANLLIQKKLFTPNVKEFSQVTIWRVNDKEIKMDIGFSHQPKIGEKVTVIPLEVDVIPIELSIEKVIKQEDACDGKLYWEIKLELIKQKQFFEVKPLSNRRDEYPFDVCVIYPSVTSARALKQNQLTKGLLPKNVFVNTVTSAIDLTNDSKPDLLVVTHCCNDISKSFDPNNDCYTCVKYYKKFISGWKLVDSDSPC